MKNELYKSFDTSDFDIGDMTVSFFHADIYKNEPCSEYTGSHFHTAYEFQYVKSGSFTIVDEIKSHKIDQGCFVIIPPGTFHFNIANNSFERFTIRFSLTSNGKHQEGFSEYCHYSRLLRAINGITVMKCDTVITDIDRLIAELANSKAMSYKIKLITSLVITDILDEISKTHRTDTKTTSQYIEASPSAEDERIKFIIENCIQQYFATDQTAERIASQLSMSKRNCARIVYRLMGENISDIVIKQRMHLAHTLICKTDMPLGGIAESVGYRTYVAFYTAFKKYFGIMPTELRN